MVEGLFGWVLGVIAVLHLMGVGGREYPFSFI
jgi:hypothetical protein